VVLAARLAKYTVSEVQSRSRRPLADARGSDQSHDRKGVVFQEYETVFKKRPTKYTVS
jgi:hypothetical protein